nr:MAG TPA: hypothetical protein [Caudoviricetes sp.]
MKMKTLLNITLISYGFLINLVKLHSLQEVY